MTATDYSSMSDTDLLVASIHELREAAARYDWDDYTLSFALGQTYSGTVAGRPELEAIWSQETAPTQGCLDLHLTEGSIEGHTAPADHFAKMVAGIAEATKEISKKKLGRKRYSTPVRVRGAGTGSVRLVLEVESHPDDKRDDSMGELASVDSESLRRVAAIIASADGFNDADSPLAAYINGLPTKARSALKKVATQISSQHWHVAGTIEQRGFKPAKVGISPAGAKRLELELAHYGTEPKQVTVFGKVDGTIDIERIVWIKPEGGKRFRAVAVDQETAEAALDLQKNHPRVMASLVVYESLGAGDDDVRRSWELQAIQLAPEQDGPATGDQLGLEVNPPN